MALSVACPSPRPARLPLRPCVGIVLLNGEGRVWIGRRCPKWARYPQPYVEDHIWQPPQGGIGRGERARHAAFRELYEETGVRSATLIAEAPGWLSYELPGDLIGIALKGRYGGQRLRWFAMRFTGAESEIDIGRKGSDRSEFDAWRWADLEELPELAVTFKRPVYEAVVAAFAPCARQLANRAAA